MMDKLDFKGGNDQMQIAKRRSVDMVCCPVCRDESKTWTDMSRHMVEKASYERTIDHVGDDPHARYLDLFTRRDQSFWGHRHDARVGDMMRRFCRRNKRLPTLQELEDARGHDSSIDI